MKLVNFGIVGLGNIANRFAKVLNTATGVKLTAVAASDLKRAEQFAIDYGSEKCYGSYIELAKDPDVEAVYIALTHNYHYEIAKLCLENGKHVLCEKPFFLYGNQARELVELANKKELTLMEAMWTRCLPAFQMAKKWVFEKRIGEPKFIQAAFCYKSEFNPKGRLFNPKLAGGALYDVGVYVLEFAMGILNEHPDLVSSACNKCETGVDDYTSMSLHFKSGTVASLTCGITASASSDAFIYGTEGKIIVHDFFQTKKCELYNEKGQIIDSFENEFLDGFIFEIEHFAKLVRERKKESPLITLNDTIGCADIFDTIREQCGLPKV